MKTSLSVLLGLLGACCLQGAQAAPPRLLAPESSLVAFSELAAELIGSPLSPPIVGVEASLPQACEPGGALGFQAGLFTLSRIGSTRSDLTVFYRLEGSASNGLDYASLAQSLVIPAGQDSVELAVEPLADFVPDGRETVTLALYYPYPEIVPAMYPAPLPSYYVATNGSATVFIADSDGGPTNQLPVVTFTQPMDGAVTFSEPILLHADAQDPDGRIVSLEYLEGTKRLFIFTNPPGPIALPFGPITILNSEASPAMAYLPGSIAGSIILYGPIWTPAPGDYVLRARATDNDGASSLSAPVHIKVLAPPTLTLRAADPNAWEPGPFWSAGSGLFVLSRTGPTNEALQASFTIGGTARNGVDFATIADWAVIPAGQSSAQILITPLRDRQSERAESVTLSLQQPIWAMPMWGMFSPPYVLGRPSQATVFIRDYGYPGNHAPSVRLVSPKSSQSLRAGASIELQALACDVDSFVKKVEFFDGVKLIGAVSCASELPLPGVSAPFSLRWSNLPVGWHTLRARATDTDGKVQLSGSLRLQVLK